MILCKQTFQHFCVFLVFQDLAISDASLLQHTFKCPDARHVLLKRADVTASDPNGFYGLLFIVC